MTDSAKINGRTKVCGLIGNPVEHTMSPVIHNTIANEKNINMVYVPLLVKEEMIKEAVKGAAALDFLGLNVTVPHKTAVIEYLDEIEETARKIGAVNTIVFKEQRIVGLNTDMPGLCRAMKAEGITLENKKVVLLGAGGVARAAAVLAGEEKVKELFIMNRSLDKAEKLRDSVTEFYPEMKVEVCSYEDIEKLPDAGLVAIQCTSIGLFPKADQAVTENPLFYKKVEIAYDLIFNPFQTKFMKLAEEAGAKSYNGLRMLLYQGIIAFEHWNDVKVDDLLAEKIYEKMKKELKADE